MPYFESCISAYKVELKIIWKDKKQVYVFLRCIYSRVAQAVCILITPIALIFLSFISDTQKLES